MRKKGIRSFSLVFASFLLATMTACGSSEHVGQSSGSTEGAKQESAAQSEANANLLEEIRKRGKVIVGTEAAFEPFEFVQDGKIVGYGSDILANVAADLGVEIEQMDLPWQGILPGLDSKRFDFVATAVTITPERAQKYGFTVPIADGTIAILKRKGDDSIKTPEDLIGKKVGSQLGSGQMQGLQVYNEQLKATHGEGIKEVKEYVNFPDAYQELATGRIDAVAQSISNLSTVIKKQPDTFEIVDKIGGQVWISWAVRQEDKELQEYLSQKIIEMRDNGKLAELQEKWFGFTMEIPDSGYLPK